MSSELALQTGKKKGLSALRRSEAVLGYLYISPWIIGFLIFTFFPFVASLYLSFTDYSILGTTTFTGLDNYVRMFTTDRLFWPSLRRTLYFAGVSVPLSLSGSLLCATLLNQKLKGTSFWRTFCFLPSLTPIVASALLWRWLLQPSFGPVNYLLGQLGIQGPAWMGSRQWAIPALIIVSLWGSVGGGQMIIFLAGLQGVPQEMYEAAEIDGAGVLRKFLNITLPMISPTLFFNLILGIIGALQVFALSYIATEGGPAYATWFYILHLFYQAFRYMNMGYASALAWIFFVIILFFTVLQIRLSNRWVFYAGELA